MAVVLLAFLGAAGMILCGGRAKSSAALTFEGKTLAQWIDLLGYEDGRAEQSAQVLIRVGEAAVPHLVKKVQGTNLRNRFHPDSLSPVYNEKSIWGLWRLGRSLGIGTESGWGLRYERRKREIDRVFRSLTTLARMGSQAKDARPALRRILYGSGPFDQFFRRPALTALVNIGPEERDQPLLMKLIGDKDNLLVRKEAARGLGLSKPDNKQVKQVAQALRHALADSDEGVRREAKEALARVQP